MLRSLHECLLKELEAQESAIGQREEALRRKIVEEERQKLLKRHAEQLLGYLPKVRLGGQIAPPLGANACVTVAFILRGCFEKMTYNILTTTLEDISKCRKRRSPLKTAGRTIRVLW